jgi:hypothetical protein
MRSCVGAQVHGIWAALLDGDTVYHGDLVTWDPGRLIAPALRGGECGGRFGVTFAGESTSEGDS